MAWISKILLFLLFLWLANFLRSLVVRVVGRALRPSGQTGGDPTVSPPQTITGKMVKDPTCGLYVAESLALSAQVEGQTHHFCSAKCRDEYLKRPPSADRATRPVA